MRREAEHPASAGATGFFVQSPRRAARAPGARSLSCGRRPARRRPLDGAMAEPLADVRPGMIGHAEVVVRHDLSGPRHLESMRLVLVQTQRRHESQDQHRIRCGDGGPLGRAFSEPAGSQSRVYLL
jgi:hypothetical protein